MHSNPTRTHRTDRTAAYLRGYAEARRDAARIAALSSTIVAAEKAIREMKPSPGAKPPKEH